MSYISKKLDSRRSKRSKKISSSLSYCYVYTTVSKFLQILAFSYLYKPQMSRLSPKFIPKSAIFLY